MPIQSIKELRNNPQFDALSDEAKGIAFGKVSTQDVDFLKLSEEARGVVRQKLLGIAPPARQFGSAVEGGPVESDTAITDVLRGSPNIAGAVGVASGFAELAGNILPSALKLGKDVAQGIVAIASDPVEVGKGFGRIASGAIEAALPGFQGGSKEDIAAFNAVADAVKGRYGSLENFSDSAIQNPAGVGQDLAILAGGLGLITKAPLATKVATILDPVSALVAAPSRAAAAATPINRLIKSNVKFNAKKGLLRVDELANAFVEQGLNLNRKSAARLQTDLKNIGKSIDDMVVKTTGEGATILTKEITDNIDNLIDNARLNGFELPDIRAMQQMKEDFLELNGEIITTVQAQELKVGLGKGFKKDVQETFKDARNKVRNVQRDTLMLRLEELHPGLKELNEAHGIKKELLTAIEKRILTIEAQKLISVSGLAAGGLAGGVAGTAKGLGAGLKFGAAAVAVDKIIENPRLQILIQKAVNKGNQKLAEAGKFIPPSAQALSLTGRVERIKPIIEITPEGFSIEGQ